ncbi:hypothetical protein CLJU_c06880 [Clostridium ljungdahlii DSM 13528]|uniref:Uncharacterized protein n=1 Tax=Clostridium ljungdahlii (strain ATCC 55383 / DSM 13528 / PETC) TaxID=748727 RepID=D8GNR2_CLOLD|nr:hypothetical protein CLJU_c06880 [Clostridium ljungdahlii DSM 13528]
MILCRIIYVYILSKSKNMYFNLILNTINYIFYKILYIIDI